jgi:hypothetical protein
MERAAPELSGEDCTTETIDSIERDFRAAVECRELDPSSIFSGGTAPYHDKRGKKKKSKIGINTKVSTRGTVNSSVHERRDITREDVIKQGEEAFRGGGGNGFLGTGGREGLVGADSPPTKTGAAESIEAERWRPEFIARRT